MEIIEPLPEEEANGIERLVLGAAGVEQDPHSAYAFGSTVRFSYHPTSSHHHQCLIGSLLYLLKQS